MRHHRPLALLGGTTAAVLALALPAAAHVSMDKASVPADSDQSLQVRVPGENPPHYNVKFILEIPAGFTAKTCADKVGWTCAIKPDTSNGRSAVVTWVRQSGVDAIDLFDLTVRTPKRNGTYKFDANQFYSDGSAVFWDGPPGSDRPAPLLEVTGANTPPVKATPAPTHSNKPGTTSTPAPQPTQTGPSAVASTPTKRPTATATTSPSVSASPTTALLEPSSAASASADPVIEVAAKETEDDGFPVLPVVLVGAVLGAVGGTLLVRRRKTET